ncbi:MAG: hypothetical protein ACR2OC_09830 [Solirubrobacterales bacterium]
MARRCFNLVAVLFAALAACATGPEMGFGGLSNEAQAAPFLRGFADETVSGDEDATRAQYLDASVRAGSQIVRIGINWSDHAPARPTNPTDPADPAYVRYMNIDAAVRAAAARGLPVSILVTKAPEWAEAPNRPSDAPPGTWRPDADAFGEFATSLARRYSGTFATPQGLLPEVRTFQVWAEPNLSQNLTPQWERKGNKHAAVGPQIYRGLANAMYAGIHAGNPDAQVIAGGTAPYGDPPGRTRMRPLVFLRELLCLRDGKRLRESKCPVPVNLDILSHHPISLGGGPSRSAIHPDDATVADFGNIERLLRGAERFDTVTPDGRHPLWATELWWETDPPDTRFGIPLKTQARWLAESLYSLWGDGAEAVVWLHLIDEELGGGGFGGYQDGLIFSNRTEKPSFEAFRFPFVADRRNGKTVAWAIAPQTGELAIEQLKQGGEWHVVERVAVQAGDPELVRLPLRGAVSLRGVIGGEASPAYRLRR